MTMTSPALEILLSSAPHGLRAGTSTIGPDEAEAELRALYTQRATGSWVRGNMITSLDGGATGADGRSGSINGPADLRVFTTLRALADVVLVGAGTVRAEGYRAPRLPDALRAVRQAAGRPANPALAVVSASGDLPDALLTDDPPPFVFTTEASPHLDRLHAALPSDHLVVLPDPLPLPAVIASLADRAMPQILTEGGPHLLGQLLEQDLLDELCLTTSPLVVGGPAPRIVAGVDWLRPPHDARPALLLHCDGVLLGRWVLRRPRL
jgi:riboflavin biosynthesis pyrimidine reductase